MKKLSHFTIHLGTSLASIAVLGFSVSPLAQALSVSTAATTNTTSTSTTLTASQQQHLQNIISKGNQEITRRLATLSTLSTKITDATKLTTSDQTTLANEVSTTTSGLTTLKTQLDGETTLEGAIADATSVVTEYRVYALVAPKITLIKVADDQQTVETRLSSLSEQLQTRIGADQEAGKDVATLQSDLTDMNKQLTASQQISSSIETKVISLQPTDYNSDHTILSGDNTQLKTAHDDNVTAYNDAKSIISGLKTLE